MNDPVATPSPSPRDDADEETTGGEPDTASNRETPRTEDLQEPSTEKEPEEEPVAPPKPEPEPSHEAVGIGVVDDTATGSDEPAGH